jgi:hypothetical protein
MKQEDQNVEVRRHGMHHYPQAKPAWKVVTLRKSLNQWQIISSSKRSDFKMFFEI